MGRGHALRGLGEAAAAQGDRPRALKLLEGARQEYRTLRSYLDEMVVEPALRERTRTRAIEAEALTLVIEANVALSDGQVSLAHARVNAAYPLFKQVGSPPSSANLWDCTAQIASWEGRPVAAMRAWQKALNVLAEDQDARARCVTGLRLAEAYLAASRLSEARGVLEQAAGLSRELEEPALLGRIHRAWGTLHLRHDAFEAALDAYRDAQGAFIEAGERDEVLYTRILVAQAMSLSGAGPDAELGAVFRALEGRAHPTWLGRALAVLAQDAQRRGRAELALVAVESAMRFWGERTPVEGRGPLWRIAAGALAAREKGREALTVVHQLVAEPAEDREALRALRAGWRQQVPADWVLQVEGTSAETLRAQARAVIAREVERILPTLGIADEALGTARGALQVVAKLGEPALPQGRGRGQPTLVIDGGVSERQPVRLPRGVFTVGRALANDIALPWDEQAAPVHFLLCCDARGVRVRPVSGAPEVRVDGLAIVGEREVHDGERVEIGSTVLRLQDPRSAGGLAVRVAGG